MGSQGGASEGVRAKQGGFGRAQDLHKNTQSVFFVFLGGPMFIFRRFFDGRPCSSWRYPDILVSPGEDPGRSWGHLGCLQELSGGPGGSVHEIGVSKGGSWEFNLAPQRECTRAEQPYY